MAVAPGHKLGQMIGDLLEEAVQPVLERFAAENHLYLDVVGERPARSGVKVTWIDDLGNSHDLDFVLERGGTERLVGTPAGFIESAWRRYTKHSKAKAQEIQGSVMPLLAQWAQVKPFTGAIVAGQWTSGALTQLRTSGFEVLHIPYDDLVAAFASVGLDISSEESTTDRELQGQVDQIESISGSTRDRLLSAIRGVAPAEWTGFMAALDQSVNRTVSRVLVTPLHGNQLEFDDVAAAVSGLKAYEDPADIPPLDRIVVQIRFTNGDRIEAEFTSTKRAAVFLETFG